MTEEEKAAQAAADEAKRLADEEAAKKKDEQPELKQFTQAQIDEMIKAAKKQATKKFEDYDTLKEQLQAYEDAKKQKELDEMSELDRVKLVLQEKEKELSTLTKAQKAAAINSAFEKAARAANIPEGYLSDARLLAGINDETDAATIEETVKTLVEAKPFLVEKKEPQQKEIGGASNTNQKQSQDKTKEQLLQEAADKAKKSGRTEDKIAYVALKRQLG